MDDKKFEKYIKENNLKTVEDYLEFSLNKWEDDIIETLKICDFKPSEFFDKCTGKQKSEWFEKIDKISTYEIIDSNIISTELKSKFAKWIKEYIFYRTTEIQRDNNIQYYTTVREQLYIYYLLKGENIIFSNKISQDLIHQSNVLSLLMNRAPAKFYNNMKTFNPELHGLDVKSLEKIKVVFEKAKMSSIVEKIQRDIDLISK